MGNNDHENISLGKAGRKRWLGKKPHNRGVVMNPVDHPMGGGEGKSSGGRHPCTPWGIPTKGHKTRKNKSTDKYIVKRRGQSVARSIKKGPYIEERLLARVRKMETESSKNVIKTWSRRSTITPELIGYTFAVHNGKKFIPVYVTENMVGHKLGEFATTRIFYSHSGHRKTKVRA